MTPHQQIAKWLTDSRCFHVLTGAGISTDSGIPDFRSPGGVWQKYSPVYFDEFLRSVDARREYWRQKCEAHVSFSAAEPNVGHRMLAKWEQAGMLSGVVTQNIDGLHQQAGNKNVLELHGTGREAMCLECRVREPIQPRVNEFLRTGEPPECDACSGPMKHATISFGQSLDEEVLTTAERWMREADLVLAMGTSLVVHPAANLPQIASNAGARIVIINREATPSDPLADLTLRSSIGSTLQTINDAITH